MPVGIGSIPPAREPQVPRLKKIRYKGPIALRRVSRSPLCEQRREGSE